MLRGWREPVEVRTVLKLLVEVMDRPELYDFLLNSGVVRDEEGVDVFRGSIEGERDEARRSDVGRGWVDTGGGMRGVLGMMDMRFIRLVSVGLMVLAPRPVACEV